MLSIVMLVKDRPRLTKQAIDSLFENTRSPFTLTIVDDGSAPETQAVLQPYWSRENVLRVENETSVGPGKARNQGIEAARMAFGIRDLLYLCDNDSFHLPNWDAELLTMWKYAQARGFRVLSGYCHPYQQTLHEHRIAPLAPTVRETYAVGLLSWLMDWQTWDECGPFDPAPTINGSEDWAYCQRVRKAGGRVGYVYPHVVLNTGMTSSDGRLSIGHEMLWRQELPSGVIIE